MPEQKDQPKPEVKGNLAAAATTQNQDDGVENNATAMLPQSEQPPQPPQQGQQQQQGPAGGFAIETLPSGGIRVPMTMQQVSLIVVTPMSPQQSMPTSCGMDRVRRNRYNRSLQIYYRQLQMDHMRLQQQLDRMQSALGRLINELGDLMRTFPTKKP